MKSRLSIREQVGLDRDEILAMLGVMVQAQREGEDAIQDIVAQRLAAVGFNVQTLSYDPQDVVQKDEFADPRTMVSGSRTAVIGRLGTGSGRSLIMFAHPDSEPVANADNWQHDAFAGTVAGSRMYGWGIADDLMGVAAMVAGVEAVVRYCGAPSGEVIIASTPSKRHARGVAAVLDHGYTADAALYIHPAESGRGLGEIKAVTSGQLVFEIVVPGRRPDTSEPGHAAFAHLAVNPLEKAQLVLGALAELDVRRGSRVRYPALDEAIGRSTNIMVTAILCGYDKSLTQLSDNCKLAGAISFPPSESMDDVMLEVEDHLKTAFKQDEWLRVQPPRLSWLSGTSGAAVGKDHDFYRLVADAIADVTGRLPEVNALHTSSDIRVPRVQADIPTLGIGSLAGNLTQTGCTDEWVDLDDFMNLVAAIASIVVEWCGKGTAPSDHEDLATS